MLKLGATLCQPRNHIFLKREALVSQLMDGKLFEAIFSEVLTNHQVKELVNHFRFTV